MPRALSLALLALSLGSFALAGCGGGGGGGPDPVGELPDVELYVTSFPATVRSGQPFEVEHRIAYGEGAQALETLVLWDMASHQPNVADYAERGQSFLNQPLPGSWTTDLVSPFAAGKLYLRAYGHISQGDRRGVFFSAEQVLTVEPTVWTGPAVEDVGLLISGQDGNRIGAFGYRTWDEYLFSLGGGTWRAADGSSLTVWLGADGLPTAAATSGGLVFTYQNWGIDSVDVIVRTAAGGQVHAQSAVAVPEARITRLQGLAAQDYIGQPDSTTGKYDLGADRAAWLAKGLSVALDVVACIAGNLTPPAEHTDAVNAAAKACGAPLLASGIGLSGTETVAEIAAGMSAYVCFDVETCLENALAQVNAALDADAALKRQVLGN